MNPQYVALLRGINVGGHHKVPMAELREEMEKLGYTDVQTLLNSGNVIFGSEPVPAEMLEERIATHLGEVFGFAIPVMVRSAETIDQLVRAQPFQQINVTADTLLYVTFLKDEARVNLSLPSVSKDESFTIIGVDGKQVFSVLDRSLGKSTDAMGLLEKMFETDMTTRNWNTVLRIEKKLE